MNIEDMAREAVKPLDSFAYFGDRDLFGTWGFAGVGSLTRDSDPLEESNHVTIWRDLESRFPDDVALERMSHCLVGWIEQILVHVYADDGSITPAFQAVVNWIEKLEDYPVADEEDLNERELDDLLDTLTACYDIPEDQVAEFASWAEYGSSEELLDEQVHKDYAEYIGRNPAAVKLAD